MSTHVHSRGESIIALGRFILALGAFIAVFVDPLEPRRFVAASYSVLAFYALYSSWIVASVVFGARPLDRRARIASHVTDLVFFGVINYLTGGVSSPFFVFFVFTIVSAMLRFDRKGTIATAAAAGVVYLVTALLTYEKDAFEINRFVIRLSYLLVVSFLLISLSDYHGRVRRDLARIAAWPRGRWLDRDQLISGVLEEVAAIFAARHVALAWEHVGERIAFVWTRDGDAFRCVAYGSDVAEAILNEVPTASSVLALPRELRPMREVRGFLTVPLEGDLVRGRLLLFEERPAILEDETLATLAARVIAGRLDHYYAAEQMQRGAVAEERVRVARDLHDSVLQSLTGVSLQLSTLPKVISRDPIEFRERISQIADIIMGAQKELRRFIENLHPERRQRSGAVVAIRLQERLAALAQRFWQQWRLTVSSEVEPVVQVLPLDMQGEIYALVSEIIANAAKHADAKRVEIRIGVQGNDALINARDDGKGFPFQGRYTLDELIATRRGPVTLKERVSSLHGNMIIETSSGGTSIDLRIPIAAVGETA